MACGCTVEFGATLEETLKAAPGKYCQTCFPGHMLSETDVLNSQIYCDKHNKSFLVHCPFCNTITDESNSTVRMLEQHLTMLKYLPTGSAVIHIGVEREGNTIRTIEENINIVAAQGLLRYTKRPKLNLENSAGAGRAFGKNIDEIRQIYEAIDNGGDIGIVLDTQHLFASANKQCLNSPYKLSTATDVIKVIESFESIATKGLCGVHLNDSLVGYGSRVDRHEVLTRGNIWHTDNEGLKQFVLYANEKDIPIVSETSNPLADMQLINSYRLSEL